MSGSYSILEDSECRNSLLVCHLASCTCLVFGFVPLISCVMHPMWLLYFLVVLSDLVEFAHIPPLIKANVDKVNYVFNVTVSAIVHYHDAEFVKDRIAFSRIPSGGAAVIFRSILQYTGPPICYGLPNTTSVMCDYTMTFNTSRSDTPMNSTGEMQWVVQFWKDKPVYSRNVTKLFFEMKPIVQHGNDPTG